MILLPLLALLGAVDAGLAKPYCTWHPDDGCLETADLEAPNSCSGANYTNLIRNLNACLSRQTRNFTGCDPEPDSQWKCSDFPIVAELTADPPEPDAPLVWVCLPANPRIDDLRVSVNRSAPADTNDGHITAFAMVVALERVNLCEGRGIAASRPPIKSGNDTNLSISAPCTCLNDIGKSEACSNITVRDEAQVQCNECNNDLDTWISDYLKRPECSDINKEAAPIQALCRAKNTSQACEAVNTACNSACGEPKRESQTLLADPELSLPGGAEALKKQVQDAGDMSAAATTRGAPVAVAVVAAAAATAIALLAA